MIEPFDVLDLTPRQAAVIHLRIPRAEMESAMPAAIGELFATLAVQARTPAGPLFAHHACVDPEVFDFYVGVPIDGDIPETGRVCGGLQPGGRVARTTFRGDYGGLAGAWEAFDAALDAAGLERAPDLLETYVQGPETDPDPATWITELVRPLRGDSAAG